VIEAAVIVTGGRRKDIEHEKQQPQLKRADTEEG
jgi:hypothetical protein